MNILMLWQALSLPRGTYPNKGHLITFVAGNAGSLWNKGNTCTTCHFQWKYMPPFMFNNKGKKTCYLTILYSSSSNQAAHQIMFRGLLTALIIWFQIQNNQKNKQPQSRLGISRDENPSPTGHHLSLINGLHSSLL